MSDLPNKVVLTSGTKYGEAKALIAAAWPRLSVQKGRGMRHLALTPSEEIHATFRYLRSCCHWPLMAADPVTVKGTSVTYPPAVSANVKDKDVQLSLTGVGLRTKVGFNVYTVASYLQDGTRVQKAEDLARTDAVRLLHLVMQRTVQPDAFIGAFRTAVGKSYPDDKFVGEFTQLVNAIGKNAADKGDNVTLLYVPGEGMRVQVSNKVDVTIKSPAFAQALWEVYLGAKPLDEGLKKGLVGRLAP